MKKNHFLKVSALSLVTGIAITFACQKNEELQSSSPEKTAKVAALADNEKVALCFDGNLHDTDDFGALPMCLALINAAGKMGNVVHVDYNNHVGCSDANYEKSMVTSATTAKNDLGASTVNFYNYRTQASSAHTNLKAAIAATSKTKRLTIIAAGPYQSIYKSLAGSTAAQREGITILSHDPWNSKHDCGKIDDDHPNDCKVTSKTWANIKTDFPGITFKEITNGNDKLGDLLKPINWKDLNDATLWSTTGKVAMKALYNRVTTSEHNGNGQSDVSDATMAYYYLHNVQNASIANVVSKLKLKWGK